MVSMMMIIEDSLFLSLQVLYIDYGIKLEYLPRYFPKLKSHGDKGL